MWWCVPSEIWIFFIGFQMQILFLHFLDGQSYKVKKFLSYAQQGAIVSDKELKVVL